MGANFLPSRHTKTTLIAYPSCKTTIRLTGATPAIKLHPTGLQRQVVPGAC